MKLPKSWTTVTPFSKTLAFVLFITLPFVGFYLGMKYQQGSSLSNYQSQPISLTPTVVPTVLPSPNEKTITLTQQDTDNTVNLKVGDRIFLNLNLPAIYKPNILNSNPEVLKQTSELIYQAVQVGEATLTVIAHPGCYPSCLLPDFRLIFKIVIQ